jgi:hypothetical protein
MWLPSLVGLAGNVSADVATLKLPVPETQIPVPFFDFNPLINNHIYFCRQQLCNTETYNKLHGVEPMVKSSKPSHLSRRDKLIIHRLRIGHTHFTRAFLLKREDPPECIDCQTPKTVEHILLKAYNFSL